MIIRHYRSGDHATIASIFIRAIHEIACEAYTPEQCLAWSDRKPNPAHWEKRCELKRPFIAEMDGEVAGFLELDPDGHIDCAYVNPDFRRKGVMVALVKYAANVCFSAGVHKVHVDASICARPLFEKAGFTLIRENVVRIGEEELLNYRMELMKETGDQSVSPL